MDLVASPNTYFVVTRPIYTDVKKKAHQKLDSTVVEVQEMFSSHGSLLTIAMYTDVKKNASSKNKHDYLLD